MSLRFHEIVEENHQILNPLSYENLMRIGVMCHLEPGMRQLDLACGKGEMLCQWAKHYGIEGTGVDISTVFLDAARKRADEFGVSNMLRFVLQDAATYQPEPDSFDIVSCIGANWIGGGTRGTLELVKTKGLKASPASLILMGEVFWREDPSEEALTAIGVQREEWAVGLDQLLEVFEAGGTHLVEMVMATDTDWDRYESKHWWTYDRWWRENQDDPEFAEIKAFVRESRQTYFRFVRPLCDWGVFVLRPKCNF